MDTPNFSPDNDLDKAIDIAGNAMLNEGLDANATIQRLLAQGYTQEQAEYVINAVYEYINAPSENSTPAQPARNDMENARQIAANAMLNQCIGRDQTIQILMEQGYSMQQATNAVNLVADYATKDALPDSYYKNEQTKGILYIVLGVFCLIIGLVGLLMGHIGSAGCIIAGIGVMIRGGMMSNQ